MGAERQARGWCTDGHMLERDLKVWVQSRKETGEPNPLLLHNRLEIYIYMSICIILVFNKIVYVIALIFVDV